ncbi:hypothetical protein BH09VER1_BH09VER1_44750 [soil metagenome]
MTFSFLLLICAVAILCGLVMAYLSRIPLPHYLCTTLQVIAFLLFFPTAFFGAFGLLEAYGNHLAPTRDTALASLQVCTANPDRQAVRSALEKISRYTTLYEGHISGSFIYFPPDILDQAASSLTAFVAPVQNENPNLFVRQQIMAIFLFDSHQRLLTWRYVMRYPHD